MEELQSKDSLEVPMVRSLKFSSILEGGVYTEPGIMYSGNESTLTFFEKGYAVYSVGNDFARLVGVDKYSNSSSIWSMYDRGRDKVYLAVQKGKGRLEIGEMDVDSFIENGPNNLTRMEILGARLEAKGYRPVKLHVTKDGYVAEYLKEEKRAVIKDGQVIEELKQEEVRALLRGKTISQNKIARLMRSLGYEE